ncbi:YbbR domain-containing protein [Weissella uvarum]|uniref:CdaR family protein n=1 Tax=Weissella uvarum TaxID=1479233 RepID=UPI001960A0D9|nr:CdaR family protein [Weissella uvarum]MBM7618013.1 YbbR domain-containing protein [Weissella uvarum]MCM0596232.1 hypothetical protein [Weissella uvarum]
MNNKLSKLGYLLISLVLAILLAAYVNEQHDSRITRNAQNRSSTERSLDGRAIGLVPTKNATFSVPLQLSGINIDNYYVSGAPEKVDITVSGSSALVTSAKNTKNFQVYADLKDLSEGDHRVKLRVSGISGDLTYKLNPSTINVNIAKRAVANYSVQTKFDHNAIADGYHAGKPNSSVENVEVMGTAEAVNTVQSVVANLQVPRDTKSDLRQDVTLQALDANGKPVNVKISPQVTTVQLAVHSGEGSRQVPIKVKPKNGDVKQYRINVDNNEATVYGKMKDVDQVKTIDVPIDLKNIKSEQVLKVKLNAGKNVTVKPTTVEVQVTPKE